MDIQEKILLQKLTSLLSNSFRINDQEITFNPQETAEKIMVLLGEEGIELKQLDPPGEPSPTP